MSDRRLMLVHAHPDDEASQSSATMARYVAEGAQVTLVTCTRGEMGEILVPEWTSFSPEELGRKRVAEIADALKVTGVTDHVWLGGLGRYHDSGMAVENGRVVPPKEMADNAFWRADLEEASLHLVKLIRDRRPHIIITYDPNGNYGHPDHIMAHRVATYATQLACSWWRADLGDPWPVSRVLWISRDAELWVERARLALERGIDILHERGDDPAAWGPPGKTLAVRIPIGPWKDQWLRSMAAHRSQVDLQDKFWRFFGVLHEHPRAAEVYQLASGVPFPPNAECIFEGLDV